MWDPFFVFGDYESLFTAFDSLGGLKNRVALIRSFINNIDETGSERLEEAAGDFP